MFKSNCIPLKKREKRKGLPLAKPKLAQEQSLMVPCVVRTWSRLLCRAKTRAVGVSGRGERKGRGVAGMECEKSKENKRGIIWYHYF